MKILNSSVVVPDRSAAIAWMPGVRLVLWSST